MILEIPLHSTGGHESTDTNIPFTWILFSTARLIFQTL